MSTCQLKHVNLPHLCLYTHIINTFIGDKLNIINKNIQVSYNSQHGVTNTHLKSRKDLIRSLKDLDIRPSHNLSQH